MALTITALTDVIELPAPESGVQGDYQTFGYWPAVGVVVGEVGFFGYINPTNFGAAAVQWDPGNDATDGVVLATAPAKRRWLLEGTGPDLLLVGWTDELLMDPEPFVMEMPVSRLTPEGGVVVAAGDAELVSHTPVVIVPDGPGEVVAAGEAELVSHTPVVIVPDGEGEVVAAGEVRLTVAGQLQPSDAGSVVTAGELVSGGFVVQVYPEGLGGLVELELTPGVWPGAARAVAVPKTFDRMNNRRYGGTLSGLGRPAWWVPTDTGNELEQYVVAWAWMDERPTDEHQIYDASGNGSHYTISGSATGWTWDDDGLRLVPPTYPFIKTTLPVDEPDDADWTLLIDVMRYGSTGDDDACLFSALKDGGYVFHLDWGFEYPPLDEYRLNFGIGWLGGTAFQTSNQTSDYNQASRIILSVKEGGNVSLYRNGASLHSEPWSGAFSLADIELYITNLGLVPGSDPFWGKVYEVGVLNGYAATADDVATNPMFMTRYGFRGSFFPSSDAPVS